MKGLTRRGFLKVSPAGLLAATVPLEIARPASTGGKEAGSSPHPHPSDHASRWPIPSCAWSRPLGSLPKIELRPDHDKDSGDIIGLNTLTRAKKGIPLGGVGAGNFMYNLCGSFGPWQLKTGRYEERFLTQAAFHVREQSAAGETKARTMATNDVLP